MIPQERPAIGQSVRIVTPPVGYVLRGNVGEVSGYSALGFYIYIRLDEHALNTRHDEFSYIGFPFIREVVVPFTDVRPTRTGGGR